MSKFIHGRVSAFLCAAVLSAAFSAFGQANFTEALSGTVNMEMVYVQGGTFQMGCEGAGCGENEGRAHSVTVSDFYIGKYELTRAQWHAVMGGTAPAANQANLPVASVDWYAVQKFICKLNSMSGMTGKVYRLPTEAEWEFAARGGTKSGGTRYSGSAGADNVAWHQGNVPETCYGPTGNQTCMPAFSPQPVGGKAANELGLHDMSGNVREWTYDSWTGSYGADAQTNPTGPAQLHNQKVRRGGSFMGPASEATVTARKIRSIEGADGDLGFRLAISSNRSAIPAGMVTACDIKEPPITQSKGTLRDDRLITAEGEAWLGGYGNQNLILRANGAAVMSGYPSVSGEWATANDFTLYIVNSSGARTKYLYYVVSVSDISLMPDNGMPGRWTRGAAAANVNVPNITSPRPLTELVPAGAVVDMENPPQTGKDERLIVAQSLGTGSVWLQDNVAGGFGGTHRYRFDYTPDTARFVVWDNSMGTSVIISSGKWFTIDNSFLRITGPNGRRYDYLYTVTANGNTHYHISYQGYERGDFRMFEKAAVSAVPQWREPTMSPYATSATGGSTFVPPGMVLVLDSEGNPRIGPDNNLVTEKSGNTSVRDKGVVVAHGNAGLLAIKGRTLSISAPAGSKVKIRIVNMAGKTVAAFSTAGAASLPLAKIPAGAYIIEVNTDGRKVTRPVVLR